MRSPEGSGSGIGAAGAAFLRCKQPAILKFLTGRLRSAASVPNVRFRTNTCVTLRIRCNCRDQKTGGVWSCIPQSNLMQLAAAKTAELAHRSRIGYQGIPNQQPKGDVYEVRERCYSCGCRGSVGGSVCLYGSEAHAGGSGGSEGPGGQGTGRCVGCEERI